MADEKPPLPAFDDPPVIETVLGVQFAPLQSFSILHLGLFWKEIRGHYRHHEILPAISPTVEQFERPPGAGARIGINLVPEPELRCWFIDETSTHLLQVQRDRFIRNWRKTTREHVYPHYDTLKPKFQHDWRGFCDFLHREGLGSPEVNQCEATYVNHIEPGRGWDSYGETFKVIRLLSPPPPDSFLGQSEMVHLTTSYPLPDKRGRLHVVAQPVFSRPLGREVLQLTLTARGRPGSSSLDGILEWFDLGHEWIVRGFTDLTTRDMHTEWRRTP